MNATLSRAGVKKILIVDDHDVVRVGLRALFSCEADLEVCADCADADSAMDEAIKKKPDIAIVDISLRGRDGLELVKSLIHKQPKLKVVVLSMYPEGVYAERALRVGAMGYVMKSEMAGRLIAVVRKVLAGQVALSDEMVTRSLMSPRPGKPGHERAALVESLTDREMEVLRKLGEGLNTRAIADGAYLSVKTIETYRERIKKRLQLANGVELTYFAVRWVQENGFDRPAKTPLARKGRK